MIESNQNSGHRIICDCCGKIAGGSVLEGGDPQVLATAYAAGFSFDSLSGSDFCGPCARIRARQLVPYR